MPEGSRLPATRHLAETLAVGRNTVENAYLQLSSEGYVESKVGSGFVVQNLQGMMSSVRENSSPVFPETNEPNRILEGSLYNFAYGQLSSPDFPLTIWKKVSNKALSTLTAEDMTRHCDQQGEPELRNYLADYLRRSRGVACSAEQVILCSGFEYALSLLCQMLREDHNQAAMEDPGYFGARELFENNGFKVVPISVESDGLNLEELENSSSGIVYVTPSHQFPSGAVMPIRKRLLLLDWARRKKGIILEDDYDSELRYNSRPIPSISSIGGSEQVIYIGTLSKALSPSIRVSYMVLPEKWLARYKENFSMYQSPVSLIQQRIIQEFMRSGHWESHLRKTCVANKKKYDLLIRSIQEFMADLVIVHGRNAGLHILLQSTTGLREQEMIEKAKERGVLVYPVSTFWLNSTRYSNNMVLLGFGNMREEVIAEGIKRLAQAWRG